MPFNNPIDQLKFEGYALINSIYSDIEIQKIVSCIEKTDQNSVSFVKTDQLFAIRQLIQTIPNLKPLLFTAGFKKLMKTLSSSNYFLTKALYFNKPPSSNWFVAYHQDLSISVNEKVEHKNYSNWTFKKGQYGVQPPLEILQNTITLRIHLDDTNEDNGALHVIPKSHLNGIIRVNSTNLNLDKQITCSVKRGGVMLMKPLTLHSSNRTTNGKQRRVIHLEFNSVELESPLKWLEKTLLNN